MNADLTKAKDRMDADPDPVLHTDPQSSRSLKPELH
jgi:hypothetical protein